ncbi:MAG TPA: N-acetylmuramoyl-L-alanine amidase [Steroidobacteraceae bacterium]|jgi:N-acetylmuramoyl-L-alanine amidase
MIRKAFYVTWLGMLAVQAGSGAASPASAELRDIELAATPDGAQLTLDLSSATSQKVFRLSGPDRTVIDLGHTRLAKGVHAPPGDGIVEDVRTGVQPGGTLRVVVKVTSSARASSAWVGAGPGGMQRLVVTLGRLSPKRGRLASTMAPLALREPLVRGAAAEPAASVAAASGAAGSGAAAAVVAASFPRIVRAPHAPADSDRDVVVAVDAGHGGQDPGAIGHGGTREKDVTLAIARALAERINGEAGMRAVLTRNKDEFIVLRDRIGRARIAKADMFISVHADSIVDRTVSGASVYVLSEKGATNEAARWLADRENAADLMGGVKLDDKSNQLASVLLDLSQTANVSASVTAAEGVLSSLDGVGQVRKSQVQQAAFVVLKSPDIPSMLIETAYISNPAEELRLKSPNQQGKLADAIFTGLKGYFEHNPPPGTRFAAQARHSTVASASLLASPATTR